MGLEKVKENDMSHTIITAGYVIMLDAAVPVKFFFH